MTSPASVPQDQDPAPVPRPRLVDPIPLADVVAEYVAQLVAVAPPLSADLRAKLAGLLNND